MARIIEDGLLACDDCTLAIASGDYSGMTPERKRDVRAGYENLFRRGYAAMGGDYGYSRRPCDCCGTEQSGNRTEFILLS